MPITLLLLTYRLERTLDLFLVLILSYSPILYTLTASYSPILYTLTASYSPILFTLIASYFLGSIIFYYTYSISLVYNLTLSRFLYISL